MLRLSKKFFLHGIEIGWLLIGHLGREKEYVAIIISLTTPEGKLLMMLLSNKSPTLSFNAMENNFKSPPSWGQILRSRPLHAGLGGVIHKFETSLDSHFEKYIHFVVISLKQTWMVLLKNVYLKIYIFVHNCTLMLSQQKNVLTSYPLTAACP